MSGGVGFEYEGKGLSDSELGRGGELIFRRASPTLDLVAQLSHARRNFGRHIRGVPPATPLQDISEIGEFGPKRVQFFGELSSG